MGSIKAEWLRKEARVLISAAETASGHELEDLEYDLRKAAAKLLDMATEESNKPDAERPYEGGVCSCSYIKKFHYASAHK